MTVKKLKSILAKCDDNAEVNITIDYASPDDYPDEVEGDSGVVAALEVEGLKKPVIESVCEL